MKTNFWKRAAALLLALVLCFACVGTASAAEDVSGKDYLISYPRDGDENYHTGSWGHDALYFRHGWKLSASDYLDVRAIGSYDANICYCIEPGVIQNTGDAFSRMGEDFWENMPDFNDLMTPQQMKRYIGRIMTYGYTGGVSTQWRSQNAGGNKLAQAYATQLLIWETVVGERDADFRYVAPTDADAVREVIRDTHPLREKIFSYYDSIVSNVQKHTKVPSFCAKNLREARTVTLEWNGSSYSAELLDTNEVLENYTFSADGVHCEVQGNQLLLTAEDAPTAPVTLTAEKKNSSRCGIITWTDGQFGMELTRSKLSVDRLTLRQKEGFLSVLPVGANQFGAQYERVLPASSAANLYPFNFSGKTDPRGLYIGRDKFGSNVLVDFDRRAEDKTTSNILILGNSGQGKSYLLKLLLTNLRESGKQILCLDPESEYENLCNALGGCYIDFLSGEYTINPLEPKAWNDSVEDVDTATPEAFKKVTRLSQHIAFLKDFFRAYKDFSDTQIDTIEILLAKLYARFGITDSTDYSQKKPSDFPVMEDFYKLCEEEFYGYDRQRKYLYTEETLQEVCLGIHSMCVGAESKYFNGHTNISGSDFLVFGVKGLLDTNKRLKDVMLFNILSFMSNQLLAQGNTVASIDELYLFLSNMTAIEYIRNCMKRVRKKDSSMILASQNIEDFLIPAIREYTKPLFSIPTHQFLFNAGQINPKEYMDALQVEPSEFELIKYPERGTCLYRCGNERYLLQVIAPEYKAGLFGSAGGR